MATAPLNWRCSSAKSGCNRCSRRRSTDCATASTSLVMVPAFREHACKFGLEGVISKRIDRPYAPGDRRIWVKSKCLNREEFVVVDRTDPEGSRSHIGALLRGYYTDDGRLLY